MAKQARAQMRDYDQSIIGASQRPLSADSVENSRSFQAAHVLTAANAFFKRSYAKSAPETLCSKYRFQFQTRTFLRWKAWPTFSTESAKSSRCAAVSRGQIILEYLTGARNNGEAKARHENGSAPTLRCIGIVPGGNRDIPPSAPSCTLFNSNLPLR